MAHEGIDDFRERGLDGLFVLNDGNGVKARVRRLANAAMSVLVEVTERLSRGEKGTADSSLALCAASK